ncbi:unknown [Lactobacillus amylovorus CAG:719]|nr:unknown [Lactobacillus amylovorus CAG:719]
MLESQSALTVELRRHQNDGLFVILNYGVRRS